MYHTLRYLQQFHLHGLLLIICICFLRVADTLIDLLILELRRLDKIEKTTKLKSIDQLHYIKKYESTLKMLGISGFAFWIGKESKHLKWRSLTGPEKLIVFKKLNISETFQKFQIQLVFMHCGRNCWMLITYFPSVQKT